MAVISLPSAREQERLTERVAAEVRALMGRYNVTQVQLTQVLGVSQTGVSKRLRGKTPFDVNEIGILADFFNVDPSELVGGTRLGPRPGGPDGGQRVTTGQRGVRPTTDTRRYPYAYGEAA
jgi:transcriptional regulator with XRE-family HTH domain